jgi:hypothetical protein
MPDEPELVFLAPLWFPNHAILVMAKWTLLDLFDSDISQKSRILTYIPHL